MSAESDLVWYFNESEGALGLRGQPYEPSFGGEINTDRVLLVAAKERRIKGALRQLQRKHQRTLELCYRERPWPGLTKYTKPGQGSYAGPACDTETARKALEALGGRRKVVTLYTQVRGAQPDRTGLTKEQRDGQAVTWELGPWEQRETTTPDARALGGTLRLLGLLELDGAPELTIDGKTLKPAELRQRIRSEAEWAVREAMSAYLAEWRARESP